MKVDIIISILICLFIKSSFCGMPSLSSMSSGSTTTPSAAPETKTPVNILTQNRITENGSDMQTFMDRLNKRETILQINQTITALNDKLNDVESQVKNRLNLISHSGFIFIFLIF